MVFLWKWHPSHEQSGGVNNKMVTVHGKNTEELVRERDKKTTDNQ